MSHEAFRLAVEDHDLHQIAASLAEEVVLHGPGTNRPFHGRAMVAALIYAAREVLREFVYTDELLGDGVAGLVFRANVGEKRAEGVDIVRLDRAGLVSDLTVMIRPLSAVIAFTAAMATHAAALAGESGTR